jgi:hypothetical protein
MIEAVALDRERQLQVQAAVAPVLERVGLSRPIWEAGKPPSIGALAIASDGLSAAIS